MEFLISKQRLRDLQSLSLNDKVALAECAINNHYEHFGGKMYVSVSGKDSIVVLHIARDLFGKSIPAVFSDTGLEYPEVREYWKNQKDVVWVRPKVTYQQVIKQFGYPVVSKITARYIRDVQNPTPRNEATRQLRLTGIRRDGTFSKTGKIPDKWMFLTSAPFKVPEQCCYFTKESPLIAFTKASGLIPMTGMRASESDHRELQYMKTGCHVFSGDYLHTDPISIFTEDDVFEFIRQNNLRLPEIYYMGEKRTGCTGCGFGLHREGEPNRFQRMAITHPRYWTTLMDKLGWRSVLEYMKIPFCGQRTFRTTDAPPKSSGQMSINSSPVLKRMVKVQGPLPSTP